jgi:hypothetical protein
LPRKSFKRSMVATLLGLLVAAPAAVSAAVLAAAPSAFADGDGCCQVSIDEMPAQFAAGADAAPFTLHVVNQTQQTLRYLDVSFVLAANGLVGDLVHLQRQRVAGGSHGVGTFTQHGVHSGVVTANDQIDFGMLALPPGGGVNIEYELSFNKKMPSAGLAISVQVQPKRSDGGVSSAGPYQSTIVAAGQPIQTQPDPASTPTPTAATTDDAPASADATDLDAAPTGHSSVNGGSSSGSSGSLMWLAYTIGALLLLGGVGVIGTLMWRREPRAVETDWDEPQQHSRPTYPTHPHGGHMPTQVGGYGMPRQASGHTAQTRVTPAVYGAGPHAAPSAPLPVPQDPFADPDQTWIGPAAGR